MDIRNWPLDRIMQLPDHCFGRRWLACLHVGAYNDTPAWDICELALPERVVFWGFWVWSYFSDDSSGWFRLALGDKLPVSTAEMDALEPLFMGMGKQGPDPRRIYYGSNEITRWALMRMPVKAAGRRPVLEVYAKAEKEMNISAWLEVSSIPTEVPDCLLSV